MFSIFNWLFLIFTFLSFSCFALDEKLFTWKDMSFSSNHTAVIILPDGNSACATYNGRDCLWNVSFNSVDFNKVIPLSCGEQVKKLYNITGYESQDHWCKITLDSAAQNGNLDAKRMQEFLIKQKENEEEQIRKAAKEREKKISTFRKFVKVGDDTSQGIIIEMKGTLVKIQTTDSQCSQRDYEGNCRNWIDSTVEKWFKRNEIYPHN